MFMLKPVLKRCKDYARRSTKQCAQNPPTSHIGIIMKSMKQLFAAGLLATGGLAAFSSSALAADSEPPQHGFVNGVDYAMYQMDQYHGEIEHMSQEDRSKLMAMQDKLMQMEMDHAAAKMKMEMETTKAQRDIRMFILTAHRTRGQDVN